MKIKPLPSQKLLRSLLRYDPNSGSLYWLSRNKGNSPGWPDRTINVWNARFSGKPAFTTTSSKGYKKGTINGIYYSAHRIIWKMQTGSNPDFIDHINGNRSDNRLVNLGSGSWQQNTRNMKISKANTSGVTGVGLEKSSGKWIARIGDDSKLIVLGRFRSFSQAVKCRRQAERDLGYHPNHGRR